MNAADFSFWTFIFVSVIFAFFALWSGSHITSPVSYFQNKKLPLNVVSLAISNSTVGAGIIYPLTLGHNYGYIMLVMPLAILIGYWLLAKTLHNNDAIGFLSKKNIFWFVQEQTKRIDGKYGTSMLPTISLLIVFVLLLALEIFTASKLLAPIMFGSNETMNVVFVSFVIFLLALFYTVWGGIITVLRTDVIQGIAAVFLFAMILYVAVNYGEIPNNYVNSTTGFSGDVSLAIIVVFLSAVATQFYNILNIAAVSRVESKKRGQLLIWTGFLLLASNAVLIISGASMASISTQNVTGDIINGFGLDNQVIETGKIFIAFILVFGISSLVYSTVDSLIITAAMLFYDNISHLDSSSSSDNPNNIRNIRFTIGGSFIFLFGSLAFFNYYKPDLINIIFMMTAGAVIYAFYVYLIISESKKGKEKLAFPSWLNTIFFIGFAGVFGVNVFAMLFEKAWSKEIFLLSIAFGFVLLIIGKQRRAIQ